MAIQFLSFGNQKAKAGIATGCALAMTGSQNIQFSRKNNMPSQDLIERLYKKMSLIRRFELRIAAIYHTDAVKSPVHLSVGQEAIAVGI